MKVYTRRGDDGSTGLFGGSRVSKADPRVECYGTVDELNSLPLPPEYFKNAKLVEGRGCTECSDGYRGRIGIFEIFMIDEKVQALIYEGVSSGVIREHARKVGMRTLREDGLRKAAAGMTSLEEVVRVTAGDEADTVQEL